MYSDALEEGTSSFVENKHKQNTVFEDKDHDMIEDLAVDPDLEKAEHEEDQLKPVSKGKGGIFE